MWIRILLVLVITGFTYAKGYGQSVGNAQHIKTIVPPSPNAANLGAYADYPVEGFSGAPDISINVYEIKLNSFTLPISLSYNASGIKVPSTASWVGLGWSLNAGGVITRSVNRFPDDVWRKSNNVKRYGYLLGGSDAVQSFSDVNKTNLQVASQLSEMSGSPHHYDDNLNPQLECREGIWTAYSFDTEPDVFYYNFANTTGKFLMGSDKKMKFIPFKNYLSEYVLDESPRVDWEFNSYGIKSFKLVDENGNQYLFSNVDSSEAWSVIEGTLPSLCFNQIGNAVPSHDYNFFSSWYLTKITTAFGEEINFNYTLEKIKTVGRTARGRDWYEFMDGKVGLDVSETRIYSNRLVSIETKQEKIIFKADLSRDDLYNSKGLTGIEVYAKSNTELTFKKKFTFDYSYFASEQQTVSIPGVWPPNDGGGNVFKRLKLDRITEVSGSLQKPPYEFNYNTAVAIPHKFSFEQDFWGYFNDNNETHPFPFLYVYPGLTGANRFSVFPRNSFPGPQYTLWGANRTTNVNTISAWTINKIKYPTGGYINFEFEPHDFYYNEQNRVGGGLRLKKTMVNDCVGCPGEITKNYSYKKTADVNKSSGVILSIPSFAYTENACGYYSSGFDGEVWPNLLAENSAEYFRFFSVRTDYAKSTLGSDEGINVGYTEIKEEVLNNGYTIRTFSMPGKVDDLNDETGGGFCDPAADGYCDDLFEVPDIKYAQGYRVQDWGGWGCFNGATAYTSPEAFTTNADLRGLDFSKTSYPFPPNINYEWNRGLLMSTKTFDKDNRPVKEESNKYKVYYPSGGIEYINGLTYLNSNNYNIKYGSNNYPEELWVYSKYRLMTNAVKVVEQISEKVFDTNDPTKFVEQKRDIFYENPLYASKTKTDLYDSKGALVRTINKYPFQKSEINSITPLSANAMAALDLMTAKNIIAPVILKETHQDNTFVGNLLVNYKIWDGAQKVIAPEDVRSKIGSNAAELNAQFHNYDAEGNLLEQSKFKDVHHSYIWGYNKVYPVADATNASANEIFYESFEENGGTEDLNAKTGRKSYGGDYSLSFALPATNQPYLLTYWYWDGGLWQYAEKAYNGSTTLSEGSRIDEVRVYPKRARMVTYTYDPLVGVTSECSANDIVTYYEYDALGRLMIVRDQDKKILKQMDYQYQVPSHNNPIWQGGETRCLMDGEGHYTGEEEQKQTDINPNSATYNTFQWVSLGFTSSCPVNVYARLSYENIYESYDETYADVVVNLYEDASGTTPVYPQQLVNVNYEKQEVDHNGYPSSLPPNPNSITCNSPYNPIEYNQSVFLDYYSGYISGYRFRYTLVNGVNYEIIY